MSEISTTSLADLRRKVLSGEEVTPEEYRSVLDSIRRARKAETGARAPKAAKAPAINTQSLLDDLI